MAEGNKDEEVAPTKVLTNKDSSFSHSYAELSNTLSPKFPDPTLRILF